MIRGLLFGGAEVHSWLGNFGLAVFRVAIGVALALGHGLAKLPGGDAHEGFMNGVRGLWEAHDLPAATFFAWCAIFAEVGAAFLLAGGLFTRIAAFFVVVNMSVAFFLRHSMDPWKVKELAFLYGTAGLLFLCMGGGKLALDRIWKR